MRTCKARQLVQGEPERADAEPAATDAVQKLALGVGFLIERPQDVGKARRSSEQAVRLPVGAMLERPDDRKRPGPLEKVS